MLPSQAGAGNGAAALARSTIMGMGRTSSGRVGAGLPRGANGSGAAAGVRGPGNGTGPPSGQGTIGGRFERDRDVSAVAAVASGSEGDSDSAEDEELVGERRGIKRTLGDMELGVGGTEAVAAAAAAGGYGGVSGAVSGAKPGKKTRGRVKIKMEFIDNKLRRYTTFSKRKTGIMKKVPRLGRGGTGCLPGWPETAIGINAGALRGGAVGILSAKRQGPQPRAAARQPIPNAASGT